jgi:DNA-binding transcriptional regulator YhcF (GntR family)
MILHVDASSAVPPYEQIREQLHALVEGGVLAPGDRLPPIRQLAGDLGLATNTVQRAYRELEAEGLIESRGRHGTVVLQRVQPTHAPAEVELRSAAESFAREAHSSGAALDDVLGTVRAAFLRIAAAGPDLTPGEGAR